MLHHSDQKSPVFSVEWLMKFLIVWRRTDWYSVVWSRGIFSPVLRVRTERQNKTTERQLPQLIYSRADLTLHLFIVHIYLFGSRIMPAVRFWAQFGLTFSGRVMGRRRVDICVLFFYWYHGGGKKKRNSIDWPTVPFTKKNQDVLG